jgi:hypothetical protein
MTGDREMDSLNHLEGRQGVVELENTLRHLDVNSLGGLQLQSASGPRN